MKPKENIALQAIFFMTASIALSLFAVTKFTPQPLFDAALSGVGYTMALWCITRLTEMKA